MAGKKEVEPLVRITTNLYESDYSILKLAYETIGAKVAIRRIVHAHVQKLRQRAEEMRNEGREAEVT